MPQLPAKPRAIEGRLATLAAGNATLAVGSNDGVLRGDRFEILQINGEIRDPVTKDVIDIDAVKIGELVVDTVRDRMASRRVRRPAAVVRVRHCGGQGLRRASHVEVRGHPSGTATQRIAVPFWDPQPEVDMFRALIALACLSVAVGSTATADAQRGARSPGAQTLLRSDLDAMTARLGRGRATPRDVMADAQRLGAGYRSLGPLVGSFGPADYSLNRDVARRSLYWLARAGRLRDRFFRRSLVPGCLRRHRRLLSRLRRILRAGRLRGVRRRRTTRPAADLLSLSGRPCLVCAGAGPLCVGVRHAGHAQRNVGASVDNAAGSAGGDEASNALPVLTPMPVPKVDVTGLDGAQRQLLTDARDRFRSVASEVHGVRVLLDQLSERLRQQGLTLNPATAATALKMQSALEDASELIQTKEFDTAIESLRSAEAQRARLRSATGQ